MITFHVRELATLGLESGAGATIKQIIAWNMAEIETIVIGIMIRIMLIMAGIGTVIKMEDRLISTQFMATGEIIGLMVLITVDLVIEIPHMVKTGEVLLDMRITRDRFLAWILEPTNQISEVWMFQTRF
jgi:hypothetical protein